MQASIRSVIPSLLAENIDNNTDIASESSVVKLSKSKRNANRNAKKAFSIYSQQIVPGHLGPLKQQRQITRNNKSENEHLKDLVHKAYESRGLVIK